MVTAVVKVVDSGALISDDGQRRTRLWRIWDRALPIVLWLMLNPSTAGPKVNDRTIETIIDFSHRWGFGGLEVCNAYSYRTKDPTELKARGYPTGNPANDEILQSMMGAVDATGGVVMAAWGAHIQPNRALDIRVDAQLLGVPLYHLGLNKDGSPRHPLYVRRDTERQLLPVPL